MFSLSDKQKERRKIMGCDGWIEDKKSSVSVTVYCYSCNDAIELNKADWAKDHIGCEDSTGRIPIEIVEENVIER